MTQAHEPVGQYIGIWDQTKLRFAEGVAAATRTSKPVAVLSNFGSKVSLHTVETHGVFTCRAASNNFVRGVLVITGSTVESQQLKKVQARG